MSRKSRTFLGNASPRLALVALVLLGTRQTIGTEALLKPAEVAALFRVDPKTVSRWAKTGKLSAVRTLGGHRRFREAEIRALVDQSAAVDPGVVPSPGLPAS